MNFTQFINRATLPALQIDAPDFCHASFLCSSLSSYYFRLLTLFSGIFHIYSLFNSKNSLATRTEFLSDCLRNLATLRATHKVQFFFSFYSHGKLIKNIAMGKYHENPSLCNMNMEKHSLYHWRLQRGEGWGGEIINTSSCAKRWLQKTCNMHVYACTDTCMHAPNWPQSSTANAGTTPCWEEPWNLEDISKLIVKALKGFLSACGT